MRTWSVSGASLSIIDAIVTMDQNGENIIRRSLYLERKMTNSTLTDSI